MNKFNFFLAALSGFGLLPLQAQVRTANVANNISVTNSPAFIDASSNTTVNGSTNVGKGIIFPQVNLAAMTSFPTVTTGIPNSFPTRFDGMIVYNTATTGTAGVGSTLGTLTAGYWYYENKSATNTGGTWKPLSAAAPGVANTASNGLTLSSNDVKLGGNLSQATTVTNNGNALNITGSGATTTFASNGYVGVGTTSPSSMMHINGSFATRYATVNASTTLDGTYHTVNAVHSSGTVTLTLPPVSGITGRQYVIQNNYTGTTNVVVSGSGTIEGQTTLVLNQVGQTAQLIAGNSEWQLVSNAIKSVSAPSGVNIYTADGTLNGNRIISQGSNILTFTGTVLTNYLQSTTGVMAGSGSVGKSLLGVGSASTSGYIGLQNPSGSPIFNLDADNAGNTRYTSNGSHLFQGGAIYSGQGVVAGPPTLGTFRAIMGQGTSTTSSYFGIQNPSGTSILNIDSDSSGNARYTSSSSHFFQGGALYSGQGVVAGPPGASAGVGRAVLGVGTSSSSGYLAILNPSGNQIGSIGSGSTSEMSYVSANRHLFAGHVTPTTDNAYVLGLSTQRWQAVYAVTGTIQTSDGRLKKDIKKTHYGLYSVMRMHPVEYNWKDGTGKHMVGFIAQEMEKIIPEAVDVPKSSEGYYGMNYNQLIPVLTKAIQEQQEQIEALKKEVQALQGKIK